MKKSKHIVIPVILFLAIFFAGSIVANAQGGSGKTTPTPTPSPAKTKPKTDAKTNITVKSKNKKIPDAPVADWEIANMSGSWTGRYSDVDCTLEIEKFEGDTFYGKMFWGEGFEIAMTGVIDRNTRKVTLTETEVLRVNPNGVWKLRVNTGTLPYGGLSMKGSGRDGKYTYKWSFKKVID